MTEPLTDADLAEIAARAAKATPGPWEVIEWEVQRVVRAPSQMVCNTLHGNDQPNAAFIAHSREDVGRLLTEVARLKGEQAKYQALRTREACVRAILLRLAAQVEHWPEPGRTAGRDLLNPLQREMGAERQR